MARVSGVRGEGSAAITSYRSPYSSSDSRRQNDHPGVVMGWVKTVLQSTEAEPNVSRSDWIDGNPRLSISGSSNANSAGSISRTHGASATVGW